MLPRMSESKTTVRRSEAVGFAFFDFANSSYTTVIVTVVYSVAFAKIVVGDGPDYRNGNLLWSLALAASYALVVLLAPVVGAIMDRRAQKKRFLLASTAVTVLGCGGLYFATHDTIPLAFGLVVLSNVGFALGESIVAAFLPELGPPESLGKLSGLAWAFGYVGGLLSTALVLAVVAPIDPTNAERVRFIGPITGAFFALGSIPAFVLLRDRGTPVALAPGETYVGVALAGIRYTVSHLARLRDLAMFLLATFFAMAGLGIVIAFAFVYGDQVIHWSAGAQAAMFVLTQISATLGAIAFGRLQSRLGDLRTFRLTLAIWILVACLVPGSKSIAAATGLPLERIYLGVGSLAGLCLGATQSASRTIVALFSPVGREGEFAGFWGLSGKLAQMVGLLSIGFLQRALGLERAILVCGAFFAMAWLVSRRVDEARGRAIAGRT